MRLKTAERDALIFHSMYGILVVAALLPEWPLSTGIIVWILVAAYNLALPLVGIWRGHSLWMSAWKFLLPLSVLQVFPDWFLSAQLGVLVFPDIGATMLGSVSSFMALMWVIPLFMAVLLANAVHERRGLGLGLMTAGLAALAIFAMSESVSWRIPLWYAQQVSMIGHMALYVLPAELLLGVSAYGMFIMTRTRNYALQMLGGFGVMLLYLGSLAFFYLLIEVI